MRTLIASALLLLALGCVGPEDNPTNVKDLRVLGVRFEPPEVMINACDLTLLGSLASTAVDGGTPTLSPRALLAIVPDLARPLKMTALIADPAHPGRPLDYRVVTCANPNDRLCTNAGDFVVLAEGKTTGGELEVDLGLRLLPDGGFPPFLEPDGGVRSPPALDGGIQPVPPGLAVLPDPKFLLQEVIEQDLYKGLGGFRIPVLLEVKSEDASEFVYAQKLMIYMCRFFPQMEENVTPILPGVTATELPWAEDEVRDFTGTQEIELSPVDFSSLQETYVMPTFALRPINIRESWKVSWHTTLGTMSAGTTGGVDFGGESGRHISKWQPDPTATDPQDVTFTLVVRDGRGGNSWLQRRARWTP